MSLPGERGRDVHAHGNRDLEQFATQHPAEYRAMD